MKLRRIISFLLVAMLMMSIVSIGVSAEDGDLAGTGYYNQDYLESYASKAVSVTGLGCTYTPTATTFKVWAPEATKVQIKLYTTGTDSESGAASIGTESMNYDKTTGVWSKTLSGDHKNQYYTYLVNRNNVIKETQDPYATAVGANGDRSMICDLDATDPDGWENDKHVLFDNPGQAVVWEIHVRDFSIDVSSGVSDANKGKYLAFTEGNTTVGGKGKIASCVDYLVEHNVTCVQLMPIEDFASIDETDNAVHRNWGYDPKNYNVPEGSYSSDPYNGNTRITEFKMLVQALHDRGIAVVMDVVYNHTFVLEGSALNLTTPNYYYRKSSAENYHNGSGLGNVLASEKQMVSKYISDSLCYWVNEYHIDGFRFDLMGCHDVVNMKKWRAALDKIDKRILMYGEPWTGGSDNGISNGITNGNLSQLDRVGAFNQGYSDALKGHHEKNDTTGQGFLNGKDDTEIRNAGAGQSTYLAGSKVNQFINYTDNHDNLTLFDKILGSNGTTGYKAGKDGKVNNVSLVDQNKNAVNNPSAQVLSQMKLALTSALTSQGIPFTVAGTEFCRTKYGDANSYRSSDELNAIDWNRAEKYKEVADYYAGLIAIRKAVNAFTNNSSVSTTNVSGCTAWQITNSASGQWNKLIVALNNTGSAKSITLSGSWVVLANGTKAGTTSLGNASGSYSIPAWSGVVLVDASSFGNYTQPNPGLATVKVEHYTRDDASGAYTKVRTETAKYKEGQTWHALKNLAILFDHNFDKVESTAAGNAISGSVTAGATITVKFYYTRFIKSDYLTVNFLNTSGGAAIKTAMKYHLMDGDAYSIPVTMIQGYELDTDRYPAATRGEFDADNPAVFNFYYKALTNETTRVHYYNAKGWPYVLCYAYLDNIDLEPLGAWATQSKKDKMLADESMGAGWVYKDVPITACRVMFHYDMYQVPGQGEKGYAVSGEAWIKDGIVSFNNTIVTSHIDLITGEKLADDVTKQYTNVSSNQTYLTKADSTLTKTYNVIKPANASGFYEAGVTNVVFLYTKKDDPGPGPDPQPGEGTLIGDSDKDGEITIIDATAIQRQLADLEVENFDEIAADCDKDGEVTIVDATLIQRWLAELPTEGTAVGERIGGGTGEDEPSEGKHTLEEFNELYNTLSQKLTGFSSSRYGSDPNYQAAFEAVSTYLTLSTDTEASAADIDAAYDVCQAALEGLDNLTPSEGEEITIYFTNNMGWSSVNAYVWGASGTPEWPGYEIYSVGTNEYSQSIYSVTVTSGDSVIFNGSEGQTVDIVVASLTANGIYCLEDTDEEGHFLYGTYNYGGSSGGDEPGGDPIPVDPSLTGQKMYLTPSAEWKRDGARFAAYFFEGTSTYVWMNMTYAGDNLYSVDIPSGFSSVIFVRMNGTAGENSWDNKWNQTPDLPVAAGTTYVVNGWG